VLYLFIPTQEDKHIEISFDVASEEYDAGVLGLVVKEIGKIFIFLYFPYEVPKSKRDKGK
jgi:hypothetical protein